MKKILAWLSIIVFLIWRLIVMEHQLSLAKNEQKRLSDELKKNNKQLTVLITQQRRNQQALLSYSTQIEQSKLHYQQQENELNRLRYENKQLDGWLNSALPADIIRLRQRPAFNSIADYRQWMFTRQSLSVSSNSVKQ